MQRSLNLSFHSLMYLTRPSIAVHHSRSEFTRRPSPSQFHHDDRQIRVRFNSILQSLNALLTPLLLCRYPLMMAANYAAIWLLALICAQRFQVRKKEGDWIEWQTEWAMIRLEIRRLRRERSDINRKHLHWSDQNTKVRQSISGNLPSSKRVEEEAELY